MFDSRQMCRKYGDKILVDRTTKGAYYINCQRESKRQSPKPRRGTSQKAGAKWQRRWPASRLSSSQSPTSRTRKSLRFLARCLSLSASRVPSRLARLARWTRTPLMHCGRFRPRLLPRRPLLRWVSPRLWPLRRLQQSFAWVWSLAFSRRSPRVRRSPIARLGSHATRASR